MGTRLSRSSRSLFEAFSRRIDDSSTYLSFYSEAEKVSELSFEDFFKLATTAACQLQKNHRVGQGDKVFIKAPNSDSFLIHACAIWLLGASIVLVSPNETEERTQQFQKVIEPKLILQHPLPKVEDLISLGHLNTTNAPSLLESFQKIENSMTALYVFTSGTTSRPKCVPLSFANLVHNAESMRRLHFREKCSHMCVLPLCHVNAFNLSFLATLYSGSHLVLNRDFHLPAFWKIIELENVRFGAIVPRIVEILLKYSKRFYTKETPTSCQYFVSAAAPLTPQSAASFQKHFAPKLFQGFGMSEAVNFSATVPPTISDSGYDFTMRNHDDLSIGKAVWGNKIRIVDDTDSEVPEGVVGELVIHGENVMSGYLDPEDNPNAFLNGGLRTGDLGYFRLFEGDRYFFLKGRKKEIIKRNGIQHSPTEIEKSIQPFLPTHEWAIVGYPNKWTGEEVGLVLAGCPLSQEECDLLLQKIRNGLGNDKAPKHIVWTESIPRTDTGKVRRRSLAILFSKFSEENLSSTGEGF